MRTLLISTVLVLYFSLLSCARNDYVEIFDGASFAGWEGNLKIFRIEDGAIVGGTLQEPIPLNQFLCTTTEYDDFQLRLKVRAVGEGLNAGIQVRSRRVPDHHEMIGYQQFPAK